MTDLGNISYSAEYEERAVLVLNPHRLAVVDPMGSLRIGQWGLYQPLDSGEAEFRGASFCLLPYRDYPQHLMPE